MVEFYRIRKETDDGPRWAINIVFDHPSGSSASWSSNKYHAILLTKHTAERAVEKLANVNILMEWGW